MAQVEVADRITAASELQEGQAFVNNLYQDTDVDYYKLPGTLFSVPSAVNVNFDLNGEKANSSAFKLSFISYDGTTETVLSSNTTAIGTSFQASAPSAGTAYYLKIEKDQVFKNFDYSLSIDVVPTAESELVSSTNSNSSLQESDPILGTSTYFGTLSATDLNNDAGDWYYFTTGSTEAATVELTLSAFTQATASGTLYNVKITDENGQTVTKVGNKSLSTSSGSSDGTLSFEVGATGTPAGTYFVQVTASDSSSFSSSTENGQNYALTLSGTSAFNTTPTVTVADITSGAYASSKSSLSEDFLGFKTSSSTKLNEFISVSDNESSTDSTKNGAVSSYLFRLVDVGSSSTSGKVTYTKDSDGTTGEITSSTSASGPFTSLSATEFASALYVAHSASEEQDIIVLVKDNSGVSLVDMDANTVGVQDLNTLSDTSGAVTYRLKAANVGISLSKVADQNTAFLTEGKTDETITLSATLEGSLATDEVVRLIITTQEDITIDTGPSHIKSSTNANEYVVSFTAEGSQTFTMTAPSVADSDGASESVPINYSVLSSNSSSLFSGLKIESDSITVKENVANFSVGTVSYSSGLNIEEGKSGLTASYNVSATGIADGQTLTLVLSGDKLDFVSDQEFSFTNATPGTTDKATIQVRAKENTEVDGDPSSALFNAGVEHTIYENGKLLTTYSVTDATISVKDNDVNFAPVAVDDTLAAAFEGVKSIVIPGSQLLSNDTDSNEDDTLIISSVSKTSAVIKDTSTDVPGTLSVSGGNISFTPDDSTFVGEVSLAFNYGVSDGTAADSGAATATLKFNEGTPVAIGADGNSFYKSTSEIEIITGRESVVDEFIFEKPDSGDLGTDQINNFEQGTDKLTLTNYTLSDYTVQTNSNGGSLVTLSDGGTITLQPDSSSSSLTFNQLETSTVDFYASDVKVESVTVNSSGAASPKTISSYDSAKISGLTDFSTQLAQAGSSSASNPIDLSDVLTQLKHIVGLRELKGTAFAAGDINNDNSIDLSDVLTALKHIVGLRPIDTFDIVTEHGLVTDTMSSGNTGELSIIVNGDANLSHSDWDII